MMMLAICRPFNLQLIHLGEAEVGVDIARGRRGLYVARKVYVVGTFDAPFDEH